MGVVLRQDGFYSKDWDPKTKGYDEVLIDLSSPEMTLLAHWNSFFEIEGQVILADLVRLLRMMSQPLRIVVGKIAQANIDAYIAPEETMAIAGDDHLAFIEVYRGIDIDVQPDGSREFSASESAHGVLKTPMCDPHDPMLTYSTVAIEFTPWSQLISVPIRVKQKTSMTTTFYRLCTEEEKKRDVELYGKHSAESVTLDRWEEQDIEITFSLGEFFSGIFDELCWFSSPARRDRESDNLTGLAEEARTRIEEARATEGEQQSPEASEIEGKKGDN